ncbi:MAG: hypothetical protein MJE77_10850 [Proteobacteria bacterium]|nr:hypothetical protein [Pseudomonadota bacterium]
MSRGKQARTSSGKHVSRQLDPGSYKVLSRNNEEESSVGSVFAEGIAGEHVIEHWILSEGHDSPSLSQDMVVAPTEDSFDSLNGFFSAMRERSRSWQSVTYVKATCEYYDNIPDL